MFSRWTARHAMPIVSNRLAMMFGMGMWLSSNLLHCYLKGDWLILDCLINAPIMNKNTRCSCKTQSDD